MVEYIVNFGETIYSIGRRFLIETDEILAINPEIVNPDTLVPGQTIYIPSKRQTKRTISANGFTLLTTDRQMILEKLRYLTYLSILSYTFNPDGTVINIDDTEIIQMSRAASVAPLMVISNTDASGYYSADLAHIMITNPQIKNRLIANILTIMSDKNYYGLVLDFEYLYPSDMLDYSVFLSLVNDTMRRHGYTIQLAIRMSILTELEKPLKDIFNRTELLRGIDQFIIMSKELSYTFGQTMFMSPLDQVQRALDAAIRSMPRSKTILGIPNSSYDWTLPRNLGIPGQPLSKEQSIELYKKTGAMLQFDASTRGYYFNYIDVLRAGHIVWMEDGHGFENYLQLVDTYNLAGVSLWTIDLFTTSDYQTLIKTYDIRKVLSPETDQI